MTEMTEPAFPLYGPMGEVIERGMSLRDYFAGMAMWSALSNQPPMYYEQRYAEDVARRAYLVAAAMLKARLE